MKKQYELLRKKFSHTKEKFIKMAVDKHGDKYDYSLVNYVNARTPIDIICKIHGIFKQTPYKHTCGQGCPKCSKNYRPTTDEFISKCVSLFGTDKYDYSLTNYVNKSTPVELICKKCGEHFYVTPHNHLVHKEGCPYCKLSKMENSIGKLLTDNGIIFEKQKVFGWLVNGKSIKKLDFFIPSMNIAIECQGLQHFKPIEYFGGESYLEKQKTNDKIKRELCNSHGIDIIYYSDIKTDFPYEVITDTHVLMEKLNQAAKKENS